MKTRAAFTAERKAEAVSDALRLGVRVAAATLGINLNTIRAWVARRQHGLPLANTPKADPRHLKRTAETSAVERPVSPPLPPGVTLVGEQGHIRTPRSLYISVARADGWWFEDWSNTTTTVGARRKHLVATGGLWDVTPPVALSRSGAK
jgi:transposase-like protein